jgi:hypothetical protein
MVVARDLDGVPRILPLGAKVDMGAYETIPEPAAAAAFVLLALTRRRTK